jgi:hypothetical protein
LREDEAQGQANEADLQSWHEARGVIDPSLEKTLLSLHAAMDRRFVLESHPAVARCAIQIA